MNFCFPLDYFAFPAIVLSIYAIASLFATVINFLFAVFVLLKNPQSKTNRLWSLAIVCIVLWGSGEFILRVTGDLQTAEIVNRFTGVGFTILPSIFLNFAFAFSNRTTSLKWTNLSLIYFPGILFSLFQVFGYITTIALLPWGYSTTPFSGYTLYIIWLEGFFGWALFLCYTRLVAGKSKEEKYQAFFLILGVSIPLFVGSVFDAFLPMAGIQTLRIAVLTTTATVGFVSYAVMKYQLMTLSPESTSRIILNAMRELLVVTDLKGTVLFFNEAFERTILQGTTTRPTHMLDFLDFVEESELLMNMREESTSQGALPTLVELHYRRADGSKFPVLVSVSKIFDKGLPIGLALLAHDLTERAQARETIQAHEKRYDKLVEYANDVIFTLSMDGTLTSLNKIFEKETGWKREEVLGKQFSNILHPGDVRTAWTNFRKSLRGESSPTFELRVRSKSGEDLVGEFTVSAEIRGGHIVGLLGIARNVTERRKAQEKIQEQAALLDSAHDAIYVRDLEGRIQYWNKGAEKIYGWSSDEAIGKSAAQLLSTVMTPSYEAIMQLVQHQGEWIGEIQQTSRNGRRITVQSHWTLMKDANGSPKSMLVINTDITEKKILETQALRAQRMDSLGKLAGGIAHDLNNILTPIILSIRALKKELPEEKRLNLLETISASAERGADMVKQILSFARGVEGERVAIAIEQLVHEVVMILKETFPKTIQIETRAHADQLTCMGDRTQLLQVLLNLCVNSRDAMPNGGKIVISVEETHIDANQARLTVDARVGRYVVTAVSDTGMGIPPEILDRIFEPFFTTKDVGKGTGLGLSTVSTIVRSHGGFIKVYSEQGHGTTFKVYFPLAQSVEDSTSAERLKQVPAGNGETILIVEDEPAIREIMKETLEANGYKTLCAKDGLEAIEIFRKFSSSISLVLTDSAMPHMDGHRTIQELRRIRPDVKVILASGLVTNGDAKRHLGVSLFLPKPFSDERLLQAVREVLK